MDFIQAAKLKHFILKNYSVVMHIHDTCGGLYFSIDEPNETVKEFILAYCAELSIPVTVSADGTTFFPGKEGEGQEEGIRIRFELDHGRAAAYQGSRLIGECTFTDKGSQWTIDHTWVEPGLRDRGIADQLMKKMSEEADKRNIRLVPVCSYAVAWMEEHR